MTQSTGRHIGPYLLGDKLGSGGMGVVYRATDTVLDRLVAIKMMHPAERLGDGVNIEEVQARFLREAKAAARIQSRHVASVLQFGHDVDDAGEPIAYIVMEFLKGRPLNKAISKGGPMAPARAVHIGVQIAKGMAAAHDLGIIHRDLKPANVMLIEEEGDPDFVKILDFGVAKLTHDQQTHGLTQAGALLGTLAFMAPEQISGKDVDARTDIYSLGIILYRMFTGVTVWDADSLSDIVRHQLSSRPPSMAERLTNPLFTAAHDAVVLRCLEKDPAARFQTMRELAAALVAADQAPRSAPTVVAVPASQTAPAPTILDAAPVEALEPTRTSPATGPTGAGRAWHNGLGGVVTSTTVAADDDGVFAREADLRGDAATIAAMPAPSLSVATPPAMPVRLDGDRPSVTSTTTPTPAGSRRVVLGLAASVVLLGAVIAIVVGRQTAPAPLPSPTSPPTTAPTAPTAPVSAPVTTPPPALAPTPNAPPAAPPVVTTPAPSVPTPPLEPTATTPAPAPAPAPARLPRSTKPIPPAPSRTPAPVPSPAPTSGFKRVHTRGTNP